MELYKQIQTLIHESSRVLICLPRQSHIDTVAAAQALAQYISSDHVVDVVSDAYQPYSQLSFLEDAYPIRGQLPPLHQLVVKLDMGETALHELSYDIRDTTLEIFLEPSTGTFNPSGISTESREFKYSLIITLGSTSLESLGSLYTQSPDFFSTTPIINIDFQPNNERFGHINLVVPTASSVSEVIFNYLTHTLDTTPLHTRAARYLLAGIVSETNGLKSMRVTPQLLETVGTLSQRGADITQTNKALFYTKPLSALKLWGRVLARLQENSSQHVVWSLIPTEDFIKTHATPKDLVRVVDDLIESYQHASYILLLWQDPLTNVISGLFKSTKNTNALDIVASFSPREDLT